MQLYKKRIFVEQNYTSSMKKEEKVRLPYVPTYGEEVANTVSHAVMLPLTLCLLPFAAVWTYLHDARPVLASVSVSVCVISIPRSAARDRRLAGCLRHRFAVDGRSAGYSV